MLDEGINNKNIYSPLDGEDLLLHLGVCENISGSAGNRIGLLFAHIDSGEFADWHRDGIGVIARCGMFRVLVVGCLPG